MGNMEGKSRTGDGGMRECWVGKSEGEGKR